MKIEATKRLLADAADVKNAEDVMNWLSNALNSKPRSVPQIGQFIQEVVIRKPNYIPGVEVYSRIALNKMGKLSVSLSLKTDDDIRILTSFSHTFNKGEQGKAVPLFKKNLINQLKEAMPTGIGSYATQDTINRNAPKLIIVKRDLLRNLKR